MNKNSQMDNNQKIIPPNITLPNWIKEESQMLMHRYASTRIPHALTLYGAEGFGKSVLAEHLAKNILCLRSKGNEACGVCQSCIWFEHTNHPDFKLIDGDGEILIGTIRELIHFSQTTAETHCKVITIINADRMNINAANSLLKLLEEPPANLYFILTTSHLERLPVTIISRVQKHFLASCDQMSALIWLKENSSDLSDHDIGQLLAYSYQAPYKSLKLYQNNFLTTLEEVIIIVTNCFKRLNLTKNVSELLKFGDYLYVCLSYWLVAHQKRDCSSLPSEIAHFLSHYSAKKNLQQYYSLLTIYNEKSLTIREDWALERWFLNFES